MINFVNFLLRVVCALAFGIILMFYDNDEQLVLYVSGILFGVSGLVVLVQDIISSIRGKDTIVPFSAYGSIIAAALMLWHPELLQAFVPLILGFLLILDCGNEVFNLLSLKFRTSVPFSYFVTPSIVLLYGIFLLFQKEVDLLVGLGFLLFSLSEIVVTVRFFKYLFMNKTDAIPEEAEPEDGIAEENTVTAETGNNVDGTENETIELSEADIVVESEGGNEREA